jgi:O-methyltransferase
MALATSLQRSTLSLAALVKSVTPPILWRQIHRRVIVGGIPDAERYQPFYSPWLASDFQALYREISPYTLVSIERCWTLTQMLAQALNVEGDVVEAGIFQGGTARLLKIGIQKTGGRNLLLFDSFEGMESVSRTADRHQRGDFADTTLEGVRKVVGTEPFIEYKKGWVPNTFAGLEQRTFCFAHIDLDLYQSILDCLEFLYPRMARGAVMVFDDYGFPSCPGARRAVEQFFTGRPEKPLALMTGQALVFKL